MMNLKLIKDQPRWRIWLVASFAKLIGVCINVEGIPFGSSRTRKKRPQDQGPRQVEPGFDDYPLWLLLAVKQALFRVTADPELDDARAILDAIDAALKANEAS